MIYKIPIDLKSDQKVYFGYYDSNISICCPINIRIHKGKFYLSNRGKGSYYDNHYKNVKNEEDMEIFVIKKNENKRFSFQKSDNYTFDGKL